MMLDRILKCNASPAQQELKKIFKDKPIVRSFKRESEQYIVFENREEAMKWSKEHFDSWADSLSSDERQAIYRYTRNLFRNINGYLHGKSLKDEEKQEATKTIEILDKALVRKPIPQNIIAYKGTSTGIFPDLNIMEPTQCIGKIISEPGYLSCSLDINIAKSFSRNVILELHIPEGTKAVALGNHFLDSKKEIELLINRGQRFKVTGYKKIDCHLTFVCEVLR